MTYATDTADAVSPRTGARNDTVDRILLGVCAAAWLAALGTAVAAAVALTELGRTRPAEPGGSETPWLLYTVIGVSALVIVGAVPLLLRARRTAHEPAPVTLTRDRPTPASVREEPTERMRVARPAAPVPATLPSDHPTADTDRLLLRGVLLVATAMGAAVVAIGAATYLMAVDDDTPAWALYGVAAVITLAMPVASWWHARRLTELLEPAA